MSDEAFVKVRGLLKRYPIAAVARGLAEYDVRPEEFSDAECERRVGVAVDQLDALAAECSEKLECSTAEAGRLLSSLLSANRYEGISAALNVMEADKEPMTWRRLAKRLAKDTRLARYQDVLNAVDQELPSAIDAVRELAGRLGGFGFLLGVLVPPYALAVFGFWARAAIFLAGYGALVAYGAVLLAGGNSSGWIFFGVAGLSHLTAVLGLYELYLRAQALARRRLS